MKRKIGQILLAAYVVIFFAALYGPIAVLIGLSFNAGRLAYVWGGFTLSRYPQVFSSETYMDALGLSLWIATLNTVLSVVFGTLLGIALARRPLGRFGLFWDALILLPLILPEIIETLSIVLFYQVVGIRNGVLATTLGHTVFSVSFVALIVRARMGDLGKSYEEASMVMGANRVVTFFRVLLPLAAPAIIAGAFLAFAASFDDVVKSNFTTAAGGDTLPLIIFHAARRGGITPGLNALATIMVAISLSAAFFRTLMERRISRA